MPNLNPWSCIYVRSIFLAITTTTCLDWAEITTSKCRCCVFQLLAVWKNKVLRWYIKQYATQYGSRPIARFSISYLFLWCWCRIFCRELRQIALHSKVVLFLSVVFFVILYWIVSLRNCCDPFRSWEFGIICQLSLPRQWKFPMNTDISIGNNDSFYFNAPDIRK